MECNIHKQISYFCLNIAIQQDDRVARNAAINPTMKYIYIYKYTFSFIWNDRADSPSVGRLDDDYGYMGFLQITEL